MLATETGIWYTLDIMSPDWIPDMLIPSIRVDMLAIRDKDNTVVAGTHGRGLFTGKWKKILLPDTTGQGVTDISEQHPIYVYPNPANPGDRVTISGIKRFPAEISVYNSNGKLLEQSRYSRGKVHLRHTIMAKGVYFIHIRTENRTRMLKVIIQ